VPIQPQESNAPAPAEGAELTDAEFVELFPHIASDAQRRGAQRARLAGMTEDEIRREITANDQGGWDFERAGVDKGDSDTLLELRRTIDELGRQTGMPPEELWDKIAKTAAVTGTAAVTAGMTSVAKADFAASRLRDLEHQLILQGRTAAAEAAAAARAALWRHTVAGTALALGGEVPAFVGIADQAVKLDAADKARRREQYAREATPAEEKVSSLAEVPPATKSYRYDTELVKRAEEIATSPRMGQFNSSILTKQTPKQKYDDMLKTAAADVMKPPVEEAAPWPPKISGLSTKHKTIDLTDPEDVKRNRAKTKEIK
jgi:hypothetical protein